MNDTFAPYFSVVIPTYNRVDSVQRALASVLVQTYRNFEIIVVDDGSTDGTEEALSSVVDSRFSYLRQANSGGSRARNLGIDRAKGAFIAFLDSDDEWLPTKLEVFAGTIGTSRSDVYYSSAIVDRGNGVVAVKPGRGLAEGEPVDEYLFCAGETISTITMVVRAELAKHVRFLDGLKKGQDLDFAVRLYRAGGKFQYIDKPLSYWNDQAASGRVSHSSHAVALGEWLAGSKRYLSRRAFYGFRANVLSYEVGRTRPLEALRFVVSGFVLGGVSFRRSLQSIARALLPPLWYRRLVDALLSSKGGDGGRISNGFSQPGK
jgi:glycosyltransferase involved in cell wall biosynthesis